MTTTLPAFPIALAIDSASSKVDSTALRRFDSSLDMICGDHACSGIQYMVSINYI